MLIALLIFSSIAVMVYFYMRMYHIRSKVFQIRKQLQDILDVLEPVALIDENSEILRVNSKYSNLVGLPFLKIIGKNTGETFRSNQPLNHQDMVEKVINSHSSVKISKHPFYVKKNPFLDEDEPILFDIEYHPVQLDDKTFVIQICRNMTALYKSQDELKRQKEILEERSLELKSNNMELIEIRNQLQENLDERDEDMEYAREIQEGLLPDKIDIPNLNSWVYYEPIQSVGGDFYDIVPLKDNRWGIFISDVAGHGLSAAFVGALAKMSLTVYAQDTDSPMRLMNQLNTSLCSVLNSGHYLTAFYGILDLNNNVLKYTRASHPGPVVRRVDGTIELLDTKGLFAGIFPEPKYEEKSIKLEKGDKLFLFTDGAFEFVEDENTKILYQDFVEILEHHAHLPIEEVFLNATVEMSKTIGVEKGNNDDVTFLALEIARSSREERMNYLIRFKKGEPLQHRRLKNLDSAEIFMQEVFQIWSEANFSEKVTLRMRESLKEILREWSLNFQSSLMVAWSYVDSVFKVSVTNIKLAQDEIVFDQNQSLFLAKTYMDDVFLDCEGRTITMVKKRV